MMIDDISFIAKAHTEQALTPIKAVRLWDKKTPYYVHPIWCAMTIACEMNLDSKTREQGVQVMLYHDVLEDTSAELPAWLSPEVKALIGEMTVKSGEQEWVEIWKKEPVVRLYKLYDKTSNMMDDAWKSKAKRLEYQGIIRRLVDDVEKNYGTLNVTMIARKLLERKIE